MKGLHGERKCFRLRKISSNNMIYYIFNVIVKYGDTDRATRSKMQGNNMLLDEKLISNNKRKKGPEKLLEDKLGNKIAEDEANGRLYGINSFMEYVLNISGVSVAKGPVSIL